jgi:hypothetical protein
VKQWVGKIISKLLKSSINEDADIILVMFPVFYGGPNREHQNI